MDPTQFDNLAKRLATDGISRRRMLRGLGSGLTGAALAAGIRPLAGAAQGNSDCAHFCQTVFPPGPDRGQCVSEAAQGGGLCYQCGPAAEGTGLTLCGQTCVQLGTDANCSGCGDVCTSPQTCGGGTPGVCRCTPEDPVTLCAGTCGTVINKCGQSVNCAALCQGCCEGTTCVAGTGDAACGSGGIACVSCNSPETCGGGGTVGACGCQPNSDETTCDGHCGTVTNNCGQPVNCTALCGGCCTGDSTCAAGTETNACGTGGKVCATCTGTQTCCGGSCKGMTHAVCNTNEDCCSGNCFNSFWDGDCGCCPSGCACGYATGNVSVCYDVTNPGQSCSSSCPTGEACIYSGSGTAYYCYPICSS